MLGIGAWDWFALFLYLIGITAIGVRAARRVKNTSDFFMGGRRFGKIYMIFFAFGSGTHADQAVGVAAKTYASGLSGIWYQWLWMFTTPFYWLIAPFFRRMRALTTGDYFDARYSASVGVLYALVGIFQLTVNIGVMLFSSGVMIEAVSGGEISRFWAIAIMTVLFVIYGVAGGLDAAITTDFIQGVLTIVLSFIVLPYALYLVGGMSGLHEKITDPHMFSLVAPGDITLFFIVMASLNALMGIVTQPHMMGVFAAGKTEMDGRVGSSYGNVIKRICTIAWMLTGLAAVVLYPGLTTTEEIDRTYGLMAADILPRVMPGLVGVFTAGLIASVMSSCDAFMVSSSGLWTQNIYRRFMKPAASEAHYVRVGRIAAVLVVAGGIAFTFWFRSVPHALETFWKIQALMGVAFWVGLFWRRATPAGAWVATLLSFIAMVIMEAEAFDAWAAATLPEYMIWEGQFRLPWEILIYLGIGFAAIVFVSLLTPRVPRERLDRVYACLRTPVQPGEAHTAPFTLPPGVEPASPRKLFDHPDLEIPAPTLLGMTGFAVLWGVVFLLVGFVYWLAQLGS
jgi:Na+/proline symporter